MKRKNRAGFFLLIILFLLIGVTSCTKRAVDVEPTNNEKSVGKINLSENSKKKETVNKNKSKEEIKKRKDSFLYLQEPEAVFFKGPKKNPSIVSFDKGKYKMNFEDIKVSDFIETMMKEVFKKNYMVEDQVRRMNKKITVKMVEPLLLDKLFSLFKEILKGYGVILEKREDIFYFKKGNYIPKLEGSLIYGRTLPQDVKLLPDEKVIFLIPFYVISSQQVKNITSLYLSSDSYTMPLFGGKVLLVNDKWRKISELLDVLNILDKPIFKNKYIATVSPKYWGIEEFAKKLKALLEVDKIPLDKGEGSLILVPIEKLSSIFVISPEKSWLERVKFWYSKLDVPEAVGEKRKIFIYKLKNVSLESVGDIFTQLFGMKGPVSKSSNEKNQVKRRTTTFNTSQVEGQGDLVVPISSRNMLLFVTTPEKYRQYLEILNKIDQPQPQLFVEVIIAEITYSKTNSMGIEFLLNEYMHNTTISTMGGLGVGSAGITSTIEGVIPYHQFKIAMNALTQKNFINILATPRLMVMDNEQANINIGTQVPIVSSELAAPFTQQQGTTTFMRSVQYRNTGILLTIKPTILSEDNIELDVSQEISEAQTNNINPQISSPLILTRSVKTKMVLQSDQVGFIGGLIKRKVSKSYTGIPILSKIPIIGHLFKVSSRGFDKTELVLFIRVKIISKRGEMVGIVKRMYKTIENQKILEESDEKK